MTDYTQINSFDPVTFSNEENQFLLAYLGEQPTKALRSGEAAGLTQAALRPILQRVYELESESESWVGVEALKKSISTWLAQNEKWDSDHKRRKNAPRWPSRYAWDAKGRGHRQGIGADGGTIKTYFGKAGERIPFAVHFWPDERLEYTPPGMDEAQEVSGLFVDPEKGRIECNVPVQRDGVVVSCGHTESYRAESRASYSAARSRMSRHLKSAAEEVSGHRELHTLEFGSAHV